MEPEAMRQQFPFYNELQAIFAARMQRMLWAEAEGGSNNKKKGMHLSSDDEEEGNEEMMSEGDHKGNIIISKKNKKKGKMVIGVGGSGNNNNNSSSSSNNLESLKEIMDEFMRQQMQMEAQWMETQGLNRIDM